MPRGKKYGGKDFPKGKSGNPEGARKHNPELKKIRALTRESLAEIGSLVVNKKFDEIERIARDETKPALQVWIANIVRLGAIRGDDARLNNLMNRIVGPVKNEIDLKTDNPNSNKSDEQILKELQEINAVLGLKKE